MPHLKSDEVADVLQIAKTRILKALARLGAVEVMPDALAVDDAWAARDPVMAHLAATAVAGLPPAGFAERKRDPVTIVDGGRPHIVGDLVVQDRGLNLHANTRAGALDEPARARLLRYVLRPPLARERLQRLPDHRVRLQLKRPWSDGTYALEMPALSLLSRLAASVPPPRQHVVVYPGVLASGSRWRPLVIPPPADQSAASADRYLRWAQLIRLTLGIDFEHCPACGGRMELRALVQDSASIERFLRHQGLWSPPHEPAPARVPPDQGGVARLHPSRQEKLCASTAPAWPAERKE